MTAARLGGKSRSFVKTRTSSKGTPKPLPVVKPLVYIFASCARPRQTFFFEYILSPRCTLTVRYRSGRSVHGSTVLYS